MSDELPSLSPHTESFGEEVSFPSDPPTSESSNSIIALYKPPTFLSILRSTAINLILPFINGVMLGFGEIFAHDLAFRWGWKSAKVRNTYIRALFFSC
jgi:Outer membrane protein TOM13